MKKRIYYLLLTVFLVASMAGTQGQSVPERPSLTGFSHAAYYAKDLNNTPAFFKNCFGYAKMTRMSDEDGKLWFIVIKINDNQFLEIMENHTVDGNPPAAQTGTPLKYIP